MQKSPTYPALTALDTRMAVLRLLVCTAAARPVDPVRKDEFDKQLRLKLTVVSVVGNPDGFLLRLELLDSADRSEDLLLDNLHVFADVGEDGGLDVVALGAETLTTGDHASAGLLAVLDVAHDPVKLELRDLRALEVLRREGVAHLVGLGTLLEALQESVVDVFLDQDARAGAAALAMVVVDTEVDP
jgi:hypothetical protein